MKKSLIKELKRERERNFKQNIDFMRMYARWLIKTPNKEWSKQHAEFLNSQIKEI